MGLDLAAVRAELALRYGFCSPLSSLLMLYEPEQFIQNGIGCPKDHPAFAAWQAAATQALSPPAKGDLGQPKTEAQMQVVVSRLAAALQKYVAEPVPAGEPPVRRRMMMMSPGGGGDERRCAQLRSAPRLGCGSFGRPEAFTDRDSFSDDGDEEDMLGAAPASATMRRQAAAECKESDECDSGSDDDDDDDDETASPAMGMGLTRKAKDSKRGCKSRSCSRDRGAHGEGSGGRGLPRSESGVGVRRDCEAYVQGKEQDYLNALKVALNTGTWFEVYVDLRAKHGSSPSFFLYTSRLVLDHLPRQAELAARICTNCLEVNLQDVQMLRSVGYFLVKAGQMELALAVFDRVEVLAPVEPQSFLDGALVRALFCMKGRFSEASLREAVALSAKVVGSAWARRFDEIEWPALVLLHMLVEIGQKKGLGDLWPLDASFRTPNFSIGLIVWLGWDTDNTDIDLHVVEPSGNEVYYSNKRSKIGGHLSKDFTQGYGPEVYLLKAPPAGTYTVKAKYYSSSQQSALTGATSAVVWSLHGGDDPELNFDTIRLDRNKEMMEVSKVHVAKAACDAEILLKFTDIDGDEIVLKREGSRVNEYVNRKLEIRGMKKFFIDSKHRVYQDDTGHGKFRADEDLAALVAKRDRLLGRRAGSRLSAAGCPTM